jgi:hypothetical protein
MFRHVHYNKDECHRAIPQWTHISKQAYATKMDKASKCQNWKSLKFQIPELFKLNVSNECNFKLLHKLLRPFFYFEAKFFKILEYIFKNDNLTTCMLYWYNITC